MHRIMTRISRNTHRTSNGQKSLKLCCCPTCFSNQSSSSNAKLFCLSNFPSSHALFPKRVAKCLWKCLCFATLWQRFFESKLGAKKIPYSINSFLITLSASLTSRFRLKIMYGKLAILRRANPFGENFFDEDFDITKL